MQFGTQMNALRGLSESLESIYSEHDDGIVEYLARAGQFAVDEMLEAYRPNPRDLKVLACIAQALLETDLDNQRAHGIRVTVDDLLAVVPDYSGE
jgi:hypothetical protein